MCTSTQPSALPSLQSSCILTKQLVMTVDLKQLKTISNVAGSYNIQVVVFTWLFNIVFTALIYAA
jgi:hypothetical protein